MKLCERTKVLPSEIWVSKDGAFDLVRPVADRLGIRLKKVRELRAIEQAKDFMFDFFKRGI